MRVGGAADARDCDGRGSAQVCIHPPPLPRPSLLSDEQYELQEPRYGRWQAGGGGAGLLTSRIEGEREREREREAPHPVAVV